MMRLLVSLGMCATLLLASASVKSGDLATERTQAATAVIIGFIRDVNEKIKEINEVIREFEELASLTVDGLFDKYGEPEAVEAFFDVLGNIERVVQEGEALAHTYDDLEDFFQRKFGTYETYLNVIETKGYVDNTDIRARYQSWSETHLDTLKNTLKAHGLHAEEIDTAERRLAKLQALSRSADGRMQAMQVGQEIAAEEIKQLHALKAIMMEQSNMHASYFATKQAMKSQADAIDSWVLRDVNRDTIIGNEPPAPMAPAEE